jgi:hypothetical protein
LFHFVFINFVFHRADAAASAAARLKSDEGAFSYRAAKIAAAERGVYFVFINCRNTLNPAFRQG